jgi:autotransporter-associated beta strand protein
VLVATNNSYNCAVFLGDANFPNGGLTLPANLTNYVSDGDAGFTNSGTMTIGGQNTSGTNTFANPIILGWTPNRGQCVTLLAAPGGTVDFTGGLRRNGTDAAAGVSIGDATHTGVIRLAGANTFVGATTVNAGTLLVNSSLATGPVTVAGGSLGGTGTINGPVTIQSGGTLSPGASVGTLTINNSLTLAGNILLEVNKSLAPSNDLVVVGGALTNAGAGILTITNLGPALAAGDTFRLFGKALPNAGGLTLNPVRPALGLAWVNQLEANGTLGVAAVATNPTNLTSTISDGNLTLSWPADHTGWTLQVQTNSGNAGLGTNWVPLPASIATNLCVLPMSQAGASVFYRLTYP